MSNVTEILVECSWCDETGHFPATRVLCTRCSGTRKARHVLGCDHDYSWSGYGDVDDPQWDGANECDVCLAVFAVWPREEPYVPREIAIGTCTCAHRRGDHRVFTDACVRLDCPCTTYVDSVRPLPTAERPQCDCVWTGPERGGHTGHRCHLAEDHGGEHPCRCGDVLTWAESVGMST